jgi:hypothetical protein
MLAMTFSVREENSAATSVDEDYLMNWPPEHDRQPIRNRDRLAYLLRWSAAHWRENHAQPRDLDALLIDAAASLDWACSRWWALAACAEAMVLIVLLGRL